MSLVNDALKRARLAQQNQAGSAQRMPPLDPAESLQPGGPRWLLPLALVLVAAGGVCVWIALAQHGNAVSPSSEAARVPALTPTPSTQQLRKSRREAAHSLIGEAVQAEARPLQSNTLTRPGGFSPVPGPNGRPIPAGNTPPSAEAKITSSNAVAMATRTHAVGPVGSHTSAVRSVSAPSPPRLQGILYDPGRPSAIVDGQTVFVGDTVRRARVTAIARDSVTLAGPEGTNVLRLVQ